MSFTPADSTSNGARSSGSDAAAASSADPPAAPFFDFSSVAAFNLGAAGSSSASAAIQHAESTDEKSVESAPLDPFSAMNHSAFGHTSASSFSSFGSFSSFPSSSPASSAAPSGFGFSSGGFASLSSIPTQIQSAPALDPARSAFSALSFDLPPPVVTQPDWFAAQPESAFAGLFPAVAADSAPEEEEEASVADMLESSRFEKARPSPVSGSESRLSGWTAAIVPAGQFGAPSVVPAGASVATSRSAHPMADGRTPVLPADAFFSIARFLNLADANTVLRSAHSGFAAQLASIPCIGLAHRARGSEDMPVNGKSLVLCRHISTLSLMWVRRSFLNRVAVQLPSLRSLVLFQVPSGSLQWQLHLPRLTSLGLGNPEIGGFCHVSGLAEHLPSLRTLMLSSAVAQSIDLLSFAGLHALTLPFSEDLSQIVAIRSLVGLRLLTFTPGGLVSTATVEQTLQSLTRRPHQLQLEEIICESQPWTDAMFDAVSRMPSLTALRPSRVGCTRLSALRDLPLLSSLHLLFASFIGRIAPVDVVAGLQPCSVLTELTLGGDIPLTTEHLTPILLALPRLREFEMVLVRDLQCFADAQETLARSLVKLTLRPRPDAEASNREPDFLPLAGLRSLRTLQMLEWYAPLCGPTLDSLRPPESLIPGLREFVFQHSARFYGSTALPYRTISFQQPQPVMTTHSALLSPLDSILQPAHSDPDAECAPLTLVEESLGCPADFLLIHTLKTKLAGAVAQTAASSASSLSVPSAPRTPAVLLSHFKHSAAHFMQIARKWGVALAQHVAAPSLYLSNDLCATIDARSHASSTHASTELPTAAESLDAYLDRNFRVESAASSAPVASPLQQWVQSVLDLRVRHSSLCIIVDSLEWLNAHASGGEREVADALSTLIRRLADMDAAEQDRSQPPSSLIVVCQGDLQATAAHSLLRRSASTFIRLRALSTGWTADVSGVLLVQHQSRDSGYWSPLQRAHYKLSDAAVKLSGADTLQL